jgi:uncharacterized protein (DUF3084 family)
VIRTREKDNCRMAISTLQDKAKATDNDYGLRDEEICHLREQLKTMGDLAAKQTRTLSACHNQLKDEDDRLRAEDEKISELEGQVIRHEFSTDDFQKQLEDKADRLDAQEGKTSELEAIILRQRLCIDGFEQQLKHKETQLHAQNQRI